MEMQLRGAIALPFAKPTISTDALPTDFEEPDLITAIMVTPGSASGNPPTPSTCEDFRKIIEEAPAQASRWIGNPSTIKGGATEPATVARFSSTAQN